MTYHRHVNTPVIGYNTDINTIIPQTSGDSAESSQSHTLFTRQSWVQDVSVPAMTAPGCGNGMAVGDEGTVHALPLARNDQ